MSGNKRKSSSDVSGNKKCQAIMMDRKVKIIERVEQQEEEEVTEEPKSFMMQEMARGFSLFEDSLLVFEAQDLNVDWYTKAAAAIQSAIQHYCVISDEKKKELLPRSVFQEGS